MKVSKERSRAPLEKDASRKYIVITGVTSGLGKALLEEYARMGHFVFGCGRRSDRVDGINQTQGAKRVHVSVADVTDEDSVSVWADQVRTVIGVNRIDLLVNNSGVNAQAFAPLWEVPQEECQRVINTNVLGQINVVRHFVPFMIERNHGVIVNVSSGQGRAPNPILAPYAISKWAVECMSKSMALALPPTMCCCPWAPGIIQSEMNPMKEFPTTSEWVPDAAPFLLSLGPKDNGKSIHTKGYYPQDVMANWIIKDGSFVDTRESKL